MRCERERDSEKGGPGSGREYQKGGDTAREFWEGWERHPLIVAVETVEKCSTMMGQERFKCALYVLAQGEHRISGKVGSVRED